MPQQIKAELEKEPAASAKIEEPGQRKAPSPSASSMKSTVSEMPGKVGNQAMQQLLKSTVDYGGVSPSRFKNTANVKTWDVLANEGKGAFVPAGAKAEDPQRDGRNFDLSKKKWVADFNVAQLKKVDDIDKLSPDQIAAIDPMSDVPYRILHDVLHQSWHVAKKELAGGSELRKALMRKLWEYRQWHHDQVLQAAKKKVNGDTHDEQGLTKWAAAGSTTLTSDIDVNLKGTQTEYAVRVFNDLFKKGVPAGHVWDVESGVAYDVNVYALDFMHAGFNFSDASKMPDGSRMTGKEGAREDLKQGGYTEAVLKQRDTGDQNIWSLVKMRLYMSDEQWNDYVKHTKLEDDHDTWTQVNARYDKYHKELRNKMAEEAGLTIKETKAALEEAMQAETTGNKQIDRAADAIANKQKQEGKSGDVHTLAEQSKMGASNRLYEEKLAEIKQVRLGLVELIEKYDQLCKSDEAVKDAKNPKSELNVLKGALEMRLRHLRRLLSEAALFSNEAYLTDGAVNHAVVGIQSKLPIKQTREESMIAVNENVADCMKEIGRHGDTLGEAAYKSSKYFFRLADAAKNMGLKNVAGVMELYEVGVELARLKKDGAADMEAKSAALIKRRLGINSPRELADRIAKLGAALTNEFKKLPSEEKRALGDKVEPT